MYEPECEQCGGGGACLGVLGHVAHFRCVQCGWTWPEDVPELARPVPDWQQEEYA